MPIANNTVLYIKICEEGTFYVKCSYHIQNFIIKDEAGWMVMDVFMFVALVVVIVSWVDT